MYAHYWNSKELVICDNVRGIGGKTFKVSGKREARKIAAEFAATPWNF